MKVKDAMKELPFQQADRDVRKCWDPLPLPAAWVRIGMWLKRALHFLYCAAIARCPCWCQCLNAFQEQFFPRSCHQMIDHACERKVRSCKSTRAIAFIPGQDCIQCEPQDAWPLYPVALHTWSACWTLLAAGCRGSPGGTHGSHGKSWILLRSYQPGKRSKMDQSYSTQRKQ